MSPGLFIAGLVAASLAQAASAAEDARSCVAALEHMKAFRPIRHKLHLAGVRSQPFHLVHRADRVNARDKPVIKEWLEARDRCFRADLAGDERAYAAFVMLTHRLLDGELSYGAYAQARMDLAMQAVFDMTSSAGPFDD